MTAPWLQSQLTHLLAQRGHAWLLSGPSGLGQFDLALALAKAWLCEQPTQHGACNQCASCHMVDVHTHPDLCALMPETLSVALGWPLDEKSQDEIDSKKRKASKEIKVDAAREVVAFSQRTRSRGEFKVVLVYPAERMNTITANTLLKTLEEPPGALKFVLATESAHQLLPTILSRCQNHTLIWPEPAQALAWLQSQNAGDEAQWQTLLGANGGRPFDALSHAAQGSLSELALRWQALPQNVARGNVSAVSDLSPAQLLDALQKICHDVLALKVGGQPRFFRAQDLPQTKASLWALTSWSKELASALRTAEHPFNAGLMQEALMSRAQMVL